MEQEPNINKKEVFKTPEGYFDKLPQRVVDNVAEKTKTEPTKLIEIIKPYLYFAAGFFILGLFIKTGLTLLVDKDSLYQEAPVVLVAETETVETDIDELIADDYVFYETIASYQNDAAEPKMLSHAIEEYLLDYDMIAELTE